MRWSDADLQGLIRRGMAVQSAVDQVVSHATQLERSKHPERREEAHQIAYIEWCGLVRIKSGEYIVEFVNAVPNGGFRTPFEAARFRAAGVQAGFPDLELVLPSGEYHGLHIEMKDGRNQPTEKQQIWHDRLRACGRKVVVCWTWNQAARETTLYLGADARYAPLTEYAL